MPALHWNIKHSLNSESTFDIENYSHYFLTAYAFAASAISELLSSLNGMDASYKLQIRNLRFVNRSVTVDFSAS